jgi:hypothetical protein
LAKQAREFLVKELRALANNQEKSIVTRRFVDFAIQKFYPLQIYVNVKLIVENNASPVFLRLLKHLVFFFLLSVKSENL